MSYLERYVRRKAESTRKRVVTGVKVKRYQGELEGLAVADENLHRRDKQLHARVEQIRQQIKRLRA